MAIVVKDRVQETSTTTGTSDFVLVGAVTGFQSFAAIGNTNTTYYAAVDPNTGAWEVGTGTYSTTGPTLTRTTIYESSNAGAKVDFAAGAKNVFCVYPAERAIYEEPSGNTLIDGGPLTVVGQGATGYTSFSAVLAELYGNVDSFAQLYAQNLNDGSSASADLVAYNDLGDGLTNFVDVGINSSNYTSVDYPIFTPNSAYLFNDGGEMFVGSATDDVVIFAGGVDTTDEAVRIDKTTKNVTTVADVDVGGDLNATGGTFTAAVTTTASMVTPATTEFVTREYVDNATSNGFHVHTPVLVATTGNLTATYSNGTAGVGATLTNSGAQAAISVDGVSLSVNDRVLVWQQTTGFQNGVYVVTTVGSGATNWVLTRSADANTSSEGDPNSLGGGDYFFVQSGATLGYHSFVCTNTTAITFGTTAITFNEFSSVPQYTGTAPINVSGSVIALTGTVAATNGGTGTNTVTTGDLLYGSGTNTWSKLAAGAGYKSLVMNAGGTNVEWNAVALNQSGAVSGTLKATNGGTGQGAYLTGDILYSSSDFPTALARLAGNTSTTKKYLTQTGTGSASDAPVWGTVSSSDVSGLGTMASQNANNVTITGGTIDTTVVGGTTPAAGTFTDVAIPTATGESTLLENTTITGWVYSNNSFSISAQEGSSTGLFFSPDGLKMYVNGAVGDDVNEYTLGTAWNITTATFVTVFSTAAQDSTPADLFFKPDGLTMFVLGDTNNTVYQYTLGTAWSVATASYASKSFSVGTQEGSPAGLWFKPDGTTMYVVGSSLDTVFQYTLGTAWDISTASYASKSYSVAAQEGTPNQVNLSDDGTKMWVTGVAGDDIWEYTLGTAWDVSTATPVNNVYVGFQDTNPTGMFIDSTAVNRVFMVGQTSDTVYQYNTATNSLEIDTEKLYVDGAVSVNGNFVAGSNVYVDGTFSVQSNSFFSATLAAGGLSSNSTTSLATSTAAQTVSLGAGATVSGSTKTLNIGTAGVSGSTTNTNIGSAVSGSLGTITLQAPTVNIGQTATQFAVTNTASAVNYVQVTGQVTGAGASVLGGILFTGSDTNVNAALTTKGTGYIAFAGSGATSNQAFRVITTSAVSTGNLIAVQGSAAGSSPSIQAISGAGGSDTNIDLTLTPKGTGVVQFGTYTATGTDTFSIAGYITVKDSAGNTRKLAVIA